jgi:uncharacterized protein involved in exopolysaccharide biosynthesis
MANTEKVTTLEIKDVTTIVRRRKWHVILPILLVTLVSFGGSYLLEKRYSSSTMVVIGQTKYLSKQLQAMIPGQEDRRFANFQQKNRLIAIKNEIMSSSYLTRLVEELGLFENQEVIRSAQKMHEKRPDIPIKNLTYHILIRDLRKNIDVDFNGEDIIEISSESNNPGLAMSIATKLAEIFKDERLQRELKGVRGALDFSDEQLAIYKINLEDAEQAKADFISEYIRDQLDESITADTNIRAILIDIDNIKLMIEDNIEDQSRTRLELSKYRKSQLVLKTGAEYERIKENIYSEAQRLADLMSKYIWSDPNVLNANLRISNWQDEMEALIKNQVSEQYSSAPNAEREKLVEFFTLQSREMVLRQKMNDFEVAISILRNRITEAPQNEIQMRNLENDVISARQIYEKFKDQLTGSEISQSLMRGEAESKYRIMEPASIPLEPVKPNRLKITILGAMLGLVIGGVAALLAELLDNSFRKIEDVEEFLRVPVLATIPSISSIKGKVKVG